MKKTFVTYLGSPNFLPGLLVLSHSLKKFNPDAELLVLVLEDIDADIISVLTQNSFPIRLIKEIKNPYQFESDERGLGYLYTKLRVFELIEYNKIVFLDADMLVCDNL